MGAQPDEFRVTTVVAVLKNVMELKTTRFQTCERKGGRQLTKPPRPCSHVTNGGFAVGGSAGGLGIGAQEPALPELRQQQSPSRDSDDRE